MKEFRLVSFLSFCCMSAMTFLDFYHVSIFDNLRIQPSYIVLIQLSIWTNFFDFGGKICQIHKHRRPQTHFWMMTEWFKNDASGWWNLAEAKPCLNHSTIASFFCYIPSILFQTVKAFMMEEHKTDRTTHKWIHKNDII